MEQLLQDVRYAIRQWRRAPLFTLCCVLILSLGSVGAIAIWTLVESLVLRTLPVHRPAELVGFSAVDPRSPEETGHLLSSALAQMAQQQQVFQSVGGYATGSALAEIDGRRADGGIAFVTPGYFHVLGVRPSLGRFLTDQEIANADPVAVVSYRWWSRHLGSEPDILNRTVRLDGVPFTIVGITEPRFVGIEVGFSLDFSVPAAAVRSIYRLPAEFVPPVTRAIGRLRNDSTIDAARTQLQAIWPGVRQSTVPPDAQGEARLQYLGLTLDVTSAARGFSYMRDWYRAPLYLLAGAMLCLLTVTSLNVATLALARARGRRQEMAVRLAIGASGRRLLRQILTESVLLSACATALTLPLGWWIARRLATVLWRASDVPPLDFAPDIRLMAIIAGSALLSGVVLGSVPAWFVSRERGAGAMQAQLREQRSTFAWSQGLLILQIGAAVVLLAAAAVLARALTELRTTEAGFTVNNVALVTLVTQPGGYLKTDVSSYLPELSWQLADAPGVRAVALSIPEPVMGLAAGETRRRVAPSSTAPNVGDLSATFVAVSPGFFELLQVRLVRGRDFAWRDRFASTPVCILSSTLATRLFPDSDAVGQHVRLGDGKRRQQVEVVGLVSDARLADLHDAQPMFAFVPLLQEAPAIVRSPTVVLALDVPLTRVAPEVTRRIEVLGQDVAVRPRTLSQQLDGSLLRERLLVLGGRYFGGGAAALVAIGLYGMLSSSVASRTRELAIRVALGAQRGALYAMVFKQAAWITGLGLAIGLPAAWVTTRVMRVALGGQMADAAALTAVALLVGAISVAATWMPARRAVAVTPVQALRQE